MNRSSGLFCVVAGCNDPPPEITSEMPDLIEAKFIPTVPLLLTPLCVNFSELVISDKLIKNTKTAIKFYKSRSDHLAFLNSLQMLIAFEHGISDVLDPESLQQLYHIKSDLDDISQLPFMSALNRSALLIDAVLTMNKSYVFSPVPENCSALLYPVIHGEAIHIPCTSDGKVNWYHNGYPISSVRHQVLRDGSLLMKNLLPIDKGVYTCVSTSTSDCAQTSQSTYVNVPGIVFLLALC